MPLTAALVSLLASHCAPLASAQTLVAVAQVESAFDPLAIGVNGKTPRRLHPISTEDALEQANTLIAGGANVDLGLGQINIRTLKALGLTAADAFDPCRNLAAAAQVLKANYDRASPGLGAEQAALRISLSLYNTGDARRGFQNGYVGKVVSAASQIVPAIQSEPAPRSNHAALTLDAPAWDVFGPTSPKARGFVFAPANQEDVP